MKFFNLLFIVASLISIHVRADDIPYDKIRLAIINADEKTFSQLVPNKKDYFAEKGMLGKAFSSSGSYLDNPDSMGSLLLACAVGEGSECRNVSCTDFYVKKLLESGARPSLGHMKAAASKLCSATTKLLLEATSENDFVSSGIWFFEYLASWTMGHPADQQAQHEEEVVELVKIAAIYGNKVKENCQGSESTSPICKIKKPMTVALQVIETQSKNEDYKKSPEGIAQNRCLIESEITRHENIIKSEKEVARISGVQNNSTLYASGKKVVDLKEDAKRLESEYKKASGKNWSNRLCQ